MLASMERQLDELNSKIVEMEQCFDEVTLYSTLEGIKVDQRITLKSIAKALNRFKLKYDAISQAIYVYKKADDDL